MNLKNDCLIYLQDEKVRLNKEFPKYERITEELFLKVNDLINTDFDGVSENKIYRFFLNTLKDIVYFSFESEVSKAYMRRFFKKLNNKKLTDCLSGFMKTKETEIKNILSRFVNFFVYWQDSDNTKNRKLDEIIKLVDGWI